MNIPILFEDDAMIAVNKPPGIVVNNAESVKIDTVQDWVEKTYHIFIENRAGIVHRIDKETSGILLIAKTPAAFAELQRQFKERIIHKTYLAIAHGKLVPDTGEINAPVDRLPWNRERFGIVPGGKESITKYHVQGYINDFSIVELYPETGRTHQIRVHLKYINHPIVGDYLYAGRKTARDDRTWAPRVMLHAWKLTCTHPASGEALAIEAPIPDDMNEIIHGRT
ncbi:MAG: RluA family pseudouridine synthase [Candidatus Gottesmanbacteria bacterium]|nr:RluA family pseudouridine synthase [Candidatus Gottesmanbacteria bacterium]